MIHVQMVRGINWYFFCEPAGTYPNRRSSVDVQSAGYRHDRLSLLKTNPHYSSREPGRVWLIIDVCVPLVMVWPTYWGGLVLSRHLILVTFCPLKPWRCTVFGILKLGYGSDRNGPLLDFFFATVRSAFPTQRFSLYRDLLLWQNCIIELRLQQ